MAAPDFSTLLNAQLKEFETSIRWQLARPPWGGEPRNQVNAGQWFAPWWPYRAAHRLKQARREARFRLSFAADVLAHGHDCDC